MIAIVFVIIAIALPAAADDLTLSVADVDSLQCPPRAETLRQLNERLAFDTALRSRHLRRALAAYARLQFLAQELAVRRKQHANFVLTHAVLLEQQRRAEVSDLDVLASQGRLLESELAIVSCVYRTRQAILDIADLALLKITLQPNSSPEPVKRATPGAAP